jgi:hypothetical protein
MRAINITPEGAVTTDELETAQLLEQLQAAVGGYIETIALTPGLVMVINEEGKVYGLPANDTATRLTQHYAAGLLPWDRIVGPALVVGQTSGGSFVDVTPDVAQVLERLGFTVS